MIDIKCPECGSSDWIYSGYAKLKKRETEKAQQFFCKDCQTTFTDKKILDQFHSKHPTSTITPLWVKHLLST